MSAVTIPIAVRRPRVAELIGEGLLGGLGGHVVVVERPGHAGRGRHHRPPPARAARTVGAGPHRLDPFQVVARRLDGGHRLPSAPDRCAEGPFGPFRLVRLHPAADAVGLGPTTVAVPRLADLRAGGGRLGRPAAVAATDVRLVGARNGERVVGHGGNGRHSTARSGGPVAVSLHENHVAFDVPPEKFDAYGRRPQRGALVAVLGVAHPGHRLDLTTPCTSTRVSRRRSAASWNPTGSTATGRRRTCRARPG